MSTRMNWIAVVGTLAFAAAAALATLGAAPAPDQPIRAQWQAGFILKSVKIGDRSLQYAVYVPRAYDPSKPSPALVFLHGSGECGTDGQKQLAVGIATNILWHADRWPCLVMIPQKPVQSDQWEQYDDLIMAMLAASKREYNVDDSRIALTGLSQGGHGTWSIGALHPDLWCALAPICAYADMHNGGITPDAIAAKVKSIPIWCFHGEDDTTVPPSQSQAVIDALKKVGADPKYTTYPKTGHNSWDKAYDETDLTAFLMTPRKK